MFIRYQGFNYFFVSNPDSSFENMKVALFVLAAHFRLRSQCEKLKQYIYHFNIVVNEQGGEHARVGFKQTFDVLNRCQFLLLFVLLDFHILLDELEDLASFSCSVLRQETQAEWVGIDPKINNFAVTLILLDFAKPTQRNLDSLLPRMIREGGTIWYQMIISSASIHDLLFGNAYFNSFIGGIDFQLPCQYFCPNQLQKSKDPEMGCISISGHFYLKCVLIIQLPANSSQTPTSTRLCLHCRNFYCNFKQLQHPQFMQQLIGWLYKQHFEQTYMEDTAVKFCSAMVMTFSDKIVQVLEEAFQQIKYRSVNKDIRNMEKIDFETIKKSNGSARSYMSISDFKPLSNLYSSVKIHEEDFKGTDFQTKAQKLVRAIQESNSPGCKLQDWMISRKAKLVLPQNYPKSEFCSKSISSYSEQALNTIKAYKFDDFCQRNVKKSKSMFFFKEKNLLKYKKDSILDSLTHLPDTKVEMSIDIFDLLLMAGGERQGSYPTIVYVWKYIYQIFDEKDEMKEQAYFQVIKQLSSNIQIYYQILSCLSATVQPSTRMYLPLLNYIYFHSLDPDASQFQEYHNFIFYSLIKNYNVPRQAPPSLFEVFCLMNLRKIPVLISFPRENIFFMESFSTVQQILEELSELYGLVKYSYLLNIEGVLLEKGSILDGLNQSRVEQDEEEWISRFTHFKGYRAFIVIKNMMEMYSCQQNFLIMYNYIVNQYRRGLFAVSNKTAFEIGGLIITSEVQMQDCYEFSLAKYLPRKKYEHGISQYKLKNIENMIIKQYESFKGTKNDARKRVIQKLSKSRAFLTHFFLCNVFIDQQQFTEAWVGLKTESMIVVQPYSNRLLTQFEYEKIRKWGSSSSQLCLKVDQLGQFHIQSRKLDTLVSIFSCYLNYLKQEVKKAGKLKPSKKDKNKNKTSK